MAEQLPSPVAASPGWYPDGGPGVRWWDGTQWTEHRALPDPAGAYPPRRRSRLSAWGLVLLVSAMLAVTVAGLALMGDPYPISRAGVATSDGTPVVLNAVCPGERLVEITVRRTNGTAPSTELWHILGDAPMPAQLSLGDAPPGMRVVTALGALPDGDAPLSLLVVTSELDNAYSMEFALDDVPERGVLSFGESYPDVDAFQRDVLDGTPCGDPYSKRGAERFAVIVFLGAVVAGIAGVALVVAGLRTDPRSDARSAARLGP